MAFPNFAQLRKQLTRTIDRKIRPSIEPRIRVRFDNAKDILLDYIDNHIVSYELRERGMMFAFFGFYANDEPVEELLDYLNEKIQLEFYDFRDGQSRIRVTFPDKEDLQRGGRLNLPWEPGKSWVEAVETGFPNYIKFLPKEDAGRSLGGIQVRGDVASYLFSPQPYLSEGLRLFRQNFKTR